MGRTTLLRPRDAAARPAIPVRRGGDAVPDWPDLRIDPPDQSLVDCCPSVALLEAGLLPWRESGAAVVVLCASLEGAAPHVAWLERCLGAPVRLSVLSPARLAEGLAAAVGRPLALRAETLRPSPASCRSLPGGRIGAWATAGAAAMAAAAVIAPLGVLAALAAIACALLLVSAALRLAAAVAVMRREREAPRAEVVPARLPLVSLLVPLYRETEIAGTLLARLAALDYPRDRLDVLLILEDDDRRTREALAGAEPPSWARVIEVPEGTLRTKPRALNNALPFARGSVVGIYDAEDVPAPNHLREVAAAFAAHGPEVACLQGALDYFNHGANWLARCFALEYASWFRVLLPGLERLGLALPLGGTTVFLRREALETLGGWDAHNVTEDADLGILLARKGFRTAMIPIATEEEANARLWPWVRQRSRWLKGYAVTWAVHMRDPRRLWREMGPRKFWGFQLMFAGTLLQFALAPVLWSFWLVPFGVAHPLAPLLGQPLLVALSILFLGAQALDLAFAWMGARRAGKRRLALWAPSLMLYYPLGTLALYRALWEVGPHPFRWDKTTHGIHLPKVAAAPLR